MSTTDRFRVGAYELAGDRSYDPETHLWAQERGGGHFRLGLDPLGCETAGDIVAISFEPLGSTVERAGGFGSMEAAKFVGPLTSPLSGVVVEHNVEILANPSRLSATPLDSWLVEIEQPGAPGELGMLLHQPDEVRRWFEAEIDRYRSLGVLAE